MKGNRPKVSASQRQLIEYELQRLQKVKFNAERMKAQGSGSLANKILQEKTKTFLSLGATQNVILGDKYDDSISDYDGENEGETANNTEVDNLASGKRKACKQVHQSISPPWASSPRHGRSHVSKQVKNPSFHPRTMADFVEVNIHKKHQVDGHDNNSIEVGRKVQDQCIQGKQHEQQAVSKKQGKKSVLLSWFHVSIPRVSEKKQKENNEDIVESNRPLNNSVTAQIRNVDDALNENDDDDALNENYDEDALENDDGVGNEFEGDQELEQEVLAQYRMEETEKASKSKRHRGPTTLPKVHARTREERQVIVLNSFGQPVGPTKEIVQEFNLFLGTVARDSELAPLNYIEFPSLPTLDKIWDYILEKYMVPQAGID